MPRRHSASRRGAYRGDLDGIQNGEWIAVFGVAEGDDPLDSRHPETLDVCEEVPVHLRREVRPAELHGADALLHAEQRGDVVAPKNQRPGRHGGSFQSSPRTQASADQATTLAWV